MTPLGSDVKFALRNLSRSKLFLLTAISSLALGIGANTAIFTLLDQLLLRLLPVNDPQQLVMIWTTGPHVGSNRGTHMASYPMYQDFQQKAQAFSYVFCRRETPLSISYNGQTERVDGEMVSGNYFQALGVTAALGRVFTPESDDRVYKGHPVVVLSYGYWTTRFASDPSVIGRKLLVNDYPMTIVGVSAAGFNGLDPATSPQIRVPIQMKPILTPGWDEIGDRRSQWVQMFARMKPGFTLESAKASLQPILAQTLRYESVQPEMKNVSAYYMKQFLARKIMMTPAGTGFSGARNEYGVALTVLMCMVGLVLLIACFNVANLLVARAAARRREIAVRLAVGASRVQILRQLLVESLMLSIPAGVLGLFLAEAIIRGLLAFLPQTDAPVILTATPDARVLAFNAGLAVLTGLVFGVAPVAQCLAVDLWNTLKGTSRGAGGSGASVGLRKALVVGQVAFSFLLLAGAALFTRTLANLKDANTGFRNPERLITFQIDPALNGYDNARIESLYRQLLAHVRTIPGVTSAAYNVVPVMSGDEWDSTMSVEGHRIKDGEDMQAFMNQVSDDYWQTMGIKLIAGRDFNDGDDGKNRKVAIVNQKFAEHFFPGQSPLGRHVAFGDHPKKLDIEIVGVTSDTLYEGPREGVHRQVFLPYLHVVDYPAGITMYVRTAMPAESMFTALRSKVRELDPELPIFRMKTLERQVDDRLSTERLIAMLSVGFGVLAALLAAIGLYGIVAFTVTRRTNEIGLRVALGASRGQVVWMVLRESLMLLAGGLAIGIPVALLLGNYIATQLYGVKPADLTATASAAAVLGAIAALAGFMPARRASEIDAAQALRYE